MVIAHNISAINTYNKMGISSKATDKSMEKLSSGYKINRAADDAAGLSISEKMRSQIRGLNQASENAENGISMIQTAEGALNESHSILQRMRELAVQAANDTNAASDREALQSEIDQLTSEINRIGNTTEFNGMKILNGSKIATTGKEQVEVANAIGTTLLARGTAGVTNDAELELVSGTTIDIVGGQGIVWSGLKAEAGSNVLTIGKNGEKVTASLTLTYENGTTVTNHGELKFDGENWGCNIHGLSFKLTNDSVRDFISNGDESDITKIDLYTASVAKNATITAGTFNLLEDGTVASTTSANDVAESYKANLQALVGAGYEVTRTDNVLTIASTTNPGTDPTDIAAAKDALKALIDGKDLGGTVDADVTAGDDTHPTKVSVTYAAVTKTSFSLQNDYEADSSSKGTITYSLDDWDSNTRLDYNRVEIEYDNAAAGATSGKLKVNFYSGSDTVISEEIACQGFGEITAAAGQTLYTYNNNGINFTIKGDKGFKVDDLVHATIDLDKNGTSIVQNNGTATDNSVYFHVGANTNQVINTTFGDMRAAALGLTGTGEAFAKTYTVNNGTQSTATERGLNISTRAGANMAIDIIDKAITMVSKERSKYGAIQNRLEYTINNLDTTSENMTSAESTVRDVDMASEMMEMTKTQILQQASQAMLTQAMQRPQQVLQLLQ